VLQFSVDLRGAQQALHALKTLEPEVAKEVGRDLSKAGRTLAQAIGKAAPKDAPVSNWSTSGSSWPKWAPISARSQRRGMNLTVSTTSSGPIAHMAEFIGNGTKIKTTDGAKLSDMFNQRLGPTVGGGKRKSPGRLGVKVIGEQWSAIKQQVEDAVEKATQTVNRRMP